MSKVKFQLGTNNYVQVSLPSKMHGDMFVGKAKVHVSGLSCSHPIKIHRDHLMSFFSNVAKVYQNLKGEFNLVAEHNAFSLHGEITHKGQVRVAMKIGYEIRNHPDYTEWQAEAVFNCEPDVLERVFESSVT